MLAYQAYSQLNQKRQLVKFLTIRDYIQRITKKKQIKQQSTSRAIEQTDNNNLATQGPKEKKGQLFSHNNLYCPYCL